MTPQSLIFLAGWDEIKYPLRNEPSSQPSLPHISTTTTTPPLSPCYLPPHILSRASANIDSQH